MQWMALRVDSSPSGNLLLLNSCSGRRIIASQRVGAPCLADCTSRSRGRRGRENWRSTPLCAVNPRSRKEWLLLHNLPDRFREQQRADEEVAHDAAEDSPGPREADAGVSIDRAARVLGSGRQEGDGFGSPWRDFVERKRRGPENGELGEVNEEERDSGTTIESRPGLCGSSGRKDRSQQPAHGSQFRSRAGLGRKARGLGASSKEERNPGVGSNAGVAGGQTKTLLPSEETPAVTEIWRNGGSVQGFLHGRGRDPEAGNLLGSLKEERNPGVESNAGGQSKTLLPSEETPAVTGIWRNKGSEQGFLHEGGRHPEAGNLLESLKEERYPGVESNAGGQKKTLLPSEETPAVTRIWRNKGSVQGFLHERGRDPEAGNLFGSLKEEQNPGMESNAAVAGGQRKSLLPSEESPAVSEILRNGGSVDGFIHGRRKDPESGRLVGSLKSLDSSEETPEVVEVWKKGRIVKRYVPLGMEFLYGRTKPTRIYGTLNSRGEVPGSGLAPVPRRYRDRCEHGKGWTVKEMITQILKLNHWDDIDLALNQWVGRFNRKNFPPLILAVTRTGALHHSVRLFTWMKAQRCYRARTDIYNLMIWLYTRHNRVDRARSLFREMQEWRCKPDLETYNALINVHGRAGQWNESLRFFGRMLRATVPPSTVTYNNLINACGSNGQWEKALEVYQKMKDDGVEVDVVTHNTVLTALKIGAQYTKAIDHFEKMLKWEVSPTRVTLNIIINCFSKMERYDEAVQLFNSMRSLKWDGCNPDLVTFTTVMHVYAACGQVANVRTVFDMMSVEGVVPNIVSYNTLIGAYASCAMDEEALDIFNQIAKVGFEPDVVSYTALMNAYSKSGKPDEAADVFDLMKKQSRKPNVVTYNTLIDAYSSAGRVMEALQVLPDMDINEVPPTVVTVCSLIVGCGRSGEIERVRDILRAAALRKIHLNVNVYNTAMSVYVNGGMYQEATRLYTVLKEDEVDPDAITFAILINGAAKIGNISEAKKHFNEMLALDIGMSIEACSALIHAYAEQGLPKDAHALLTRMKESGCPPNVMTYTSLIYAYSIAEMSEAAIAVFDEMENMGVELDAVACSALFTVFNQCGEAKKALSLWSKWKKKLHFGKTAYTQLSRACSMLRDWTTAIELFQEMQKVGVIPDSTIGDNLLRSIGKSGKVQQLKKVFWQLQQSGTMATKETYNILIDCYSRSQDWRECLEILGRFEADDIQPDLKTYEMVLKCLERVQLHEKYVDVYKQMKSKGYFLDSVTSKVTLDAYKEMGQERKAQELKSVVEDLRQEKKSTLREAVEALSRAC